MSPWRERGWGERQKGSERERARDRGRKRERGGERDRAQDRGRKGVRDEGRERETVFKQQAVPCRKTAYRDMIY